MQIKTSDIFVFILILALGIVSVLALTTYQHNKSLNEIIDTKNKILDDLLLNDSLFKASQKQYSKSIERYVQNCSYIVDGKKISSDELVKLVTNLYDQNYAKSDSLKYYIAVKKIDDDSKGILLKKIKELQPCYDSLSITKTVIEQIEKSYGTRISATISGNTIKISRKVSKADSAFAVYKYYKHKLKTNGDEWTVEIDPSNPNKDKPKK